MHVTSDIWSINKIPVSIEKHITFCTQMEYLFTLHQRWHVQESEWELLIGHSQHEGK